MTTDRILTGVGLRLFAIFCLASMAAIIKLAEARGAALAEIIFFRQLVAVPVVVAWLAIGVGLLALGSRFDARSLRIASAVIVILTVAKVFLIDMANLEGVLRALSFIGLGFVLIGIGLFYQKILTGKTARPAAVDEDEAPTGI